MKSTDLNSYPRILTPQLKPYDPLDVAERTREIVCEGNARKYTRIYCVGVYGGISTAYTVGCNLRCAFCWVGWGRDYPERHGKLYTPDQVFDRLVKNAKKRKISKLRISGGEPTLCKEHLLDVLDRIEKTDYQFILETNGTIFGADRDYVMSLKKYTSVYTRVSIKAGTGKGFQNRTGAIAESFELPYRAVQYLLEAEVPFHVAAMSDPKLMSEEERLAMIQKLADVGYTGSIEEEVCDPYPTSVTRLNEAGFKIFG